MTHRTPTLVLALLAMLAIGGPDANAQDDNDAEQRARVLVESAAQLGRNGRLEEAIATFKQAEAIHPRAIHDCNIGLAYVRLEKWPQAQFFLSHCRERWSQEQTAPIEEWVNRRLREAISKLEAGGYAPIAFTTSPADATLQLSTFLADETFAAPRIVWVAAGKAEISAQRAGYESQRRHITVTKGEQQTVSIVLEPSEAPTTPDSTGSNEFGDPAPDSTSPTAVAVPEAVDVEANTQVTAPSKTWPWILIGSGAVLAGAGVFFHSAALDAKQEAESFAPGDDFDTWNERFSTRRNVTYGLYGVGAATLGAGLYFLLHDDEETRESTTLVRLYSDGANTGIALHWTLP